MWATCTFVRSPPTVQGALSEPKAPDRQRLPIPMKSWRSGSTIARRPCMTRVLSMTATSPSCQLISCVHPSA
jgi:hypothetical protein